MAVSKWGQQLRLHQGERRACILVPFPADLPASATSAPGSIAALLASANGPISFSDSSGMPGFMSTNVGEPQ